MLLLPLLLYLLYYYTYYYYSDICQLCDSAAQKSYETAVASLQQVILSSTADMKEMVEEVSALKGNIAPTSAYNTTAIQYTSSGSTTTSRDGNSSGLPFSLSGPMSNSSMHGSSTTTRRSSFLSTPTPPTPKPHYDIWMCIQRYRQVVRDSQEAMCVLITEHMDLELHMQILSNKVYSLFLTIASTYHTEQTALWEESLQLFGNLLGDTIVRMDSIGRPYPILQSPFAKIEEAVALASNPSTPIKNTNSDTKASHLHTPKGPKTPGEIQYQDFPQHIGVFSFIVLYKDPLPLCPSICLSGNILYTKKKEFMKSQSNILTTAIWKTVYVVLTSDGFLHLLYREKYNIPDISYAIKVRFILLLLHTFFSVLFNCIIYI